MDETQARKRITLVCDAITALGILGNLDLALKHPLNTGPSTVLVKSFREQILGKIAETEFLSPEELALAHNAEEVDISRREAQQRLMAEWDDDT